MTLFFSSLETICRFIIFIITLHDMMHQNLSFNRNTLKRTHYFTMNTGLTFSPLHLQQWVNLHSWEHFPGVSSCFFPDSWLSSYHICILFTEPSFSGTIMMEATYIFSIVFRFIKHNMYRNPTQTNCFQIVRFSFFSTVVNSHWEPATYILWYFFFLIIITIIIIILLYTKAQKVGSKAGVKLHKTAIILLMIFKHCTK